MLSIELSRENDFLAGSELAITCNITVDYAVDTPFFVNATWTMIDQADASGAADTDPLDQDVLSGVDDSTNTTERITVLNPFETSFNTYSTQIIFSTLSSSMDSGIYTCNVSIISYDYVSNADTDAISTNLTVIGKLNYWYGQILILYFRSCD